MPYAVDRDYCAGSDLFEVEWLPGGCVLARTKDLVVDDYYPFAGKAFSEDVIHSLRWREKGVRLFVAPNIAVSTNITALPLTFSEIRSDYYARKYIVSLMGGSVVRCLCWFVWFILRERALYPLKGRRH
jgi:hypothetical protein